MAGVAEACGAKSAVLVLVDARNKQLAVADSGELARAAQDLEFVLGEGPSRDAATRHGPVGATGDAIVARWASCGPAVTALGIRAVAAAPLDTGASARCFGALAVFDPRQAAGMVSAHVGCRVDGALALIRARVFSRGMPVEALVRAIVAGDLTLTPKGPS
ncbi:hypothetical protein [Streptomyces sp. NPDC017941]|uniref:hypothetical protein n=1 Tax=Streptomyces sp. NPDC017941 TaxID=3365018 RepID=UPI003791AFBB